MVATFKNPRLQGLFLITAFSKLAFQFAVANVNNTSKDSPNYLKTVVLWILRKDDKDADDTALLASEGLEPVPETLCSQAFQQARLPFEGTPPERTDDVMGVLYSKIVSTLLRLSGVFVIDVNMAGNIFRAFMMGLELKQHDAVQQALGSAIDKELLKALAAVTRLCVGATARLKFPVINTVNDLPPVLNQLPVADGNSDELAWLFMSHGLNLNSPDYIPAFNPGGVQANMWGSNVQAQKAFLDRFSDELEELCQVEKAHGHLPVEEADRVFPRVNLTYVYYAFEEFKLLKSARA